VKVLLAEIHKRGYTGYHSHLARFLAPWRMDLHTIAMMPANRSSPPKAEAATLPPMAPLDPMTGRRISSLTAAALCVKPRGEMTPRQIVHVDLLKATSSVFTTMPELAMRFAGLLRGGEGALQNLESLARCFTAMGAILPRAQSQRSFDAFHQERRRLADA
jgi:hypothetical protein